jgi:hypothetical protein
MEFDSLISVGWRLLPNAPIVQYLNDNSKVVSPFAANALNETCRRDSLRISL